jgi:hypothetical protein
LTANALNPKNFVKTLRGGAYAYIPKQEMINISDFLSEMIEASEMLEAKEKGSEKPNKWFKKLSSFFDETFGADWKNKHKEDLKDLNLMNS